MPDDPPAAAPAATAASLLLMRPAAGGPELLVVVRAAGLAFGGGAYAFPGGRVDPADRAAAAAHPAPDPPALDPDDAAARIAALRETAEETGIDLRGPAPGLAALTPFARWCPPDSGVARRFDTRFYLAEGAADQRPVADGSEIADAFWARPDAILAACRRGEGRALFPTRRLLERLAKFGSVADARAEALALPQVTIGGRRERRSDGEWLTIPAGLGYPVTEERLSDVARS